MATGPCWRLSALSDDWSKVHVSEEWARKSPIARRIAQGLSGLAVTDGLKLRAWLDEFAAIASPAWRWNFKRPTFLDDTIHVRCRLREKRKTNRLGLGIFCLALQLINQRGGDPGRGASA